MSKQYITVDGNEAVARIAHKTNEVAIIYPITPSTPLGELSDILSSQGQTNIWGNVPDVVEMQSEAGAAGALHGALQAGSIGTTFTASQGLLLKIPNMYKIAGELTPTVFHVTARSLAAQGLSIFGDHQDVMAARATGFAMLASASVQEAMDFALISQAATFESRVPFMHFYDGFRTSHEVCKIENINDDIIREMINDDLIREHRARALNPNKPTMTGTSQNPDVYFQGRETVNAYYNATPAIVQSVMDKFAKLTGRQYAPFEYYGAEDADRVIMVMGSGIGPIQETIDYLNANGEKIGMVKVRLYRPFSAELLVDAIPASVKSIAVLDRTKEPGCLGEPLYLDVVTALVEKGRTDVKTIGGRFGLSSKEFTPAMVKAIYDELNKPQPKNHFTIGINDDLNNTSLDYDISFDLEKENVVRSMFFGLGSDGTVGANKNTIKIIGTGTDNYAQGYFVYDSKKAGSTTTSHLRFGPEPINSTYLISSANFVGVHQFQFLETTDVLGKIVKGGTFLLNSPYSVDEVWNHLPGQIQKTIIEKELKFYVIDAYSVAKNAGMGNRINVVMQTCFFKLSGILPEDEAIAKIKEAIKKTYGKKGDKVVNMNNAAVDDSLSHLQEVNVPNNVTSEVVKHSLVPADADEFVVKVTAEIMAGRGDDLPVSAMPVDGTFPTGTSSYEKSNVSATVPVWNEDICIQCGACGLACPHSCISMKQVTDEQLAGAPATLKKAPLKGKGADGKNFLLQVAVEDCTGCSLCVEVCPVKDKAVEGKKAINMDDKEPILEAERANLIFHDSLPVVPRSEVDLNTVKGTQYLESTFKYSGACAGCGETPYVRLLSQLFGDRLMIANATGCSSIYGGNLPTTPWHKSQSGKGPTWSNSLFEDNAEFGFGFSVTARKNRVIATDLLKKLSDKLDSALVDGLLNAVQENEADYEAQANRVKELESALAGMEDNDAKHLLSLADFFIDRSIWSVGGDGWAYDIGYGGLDHVLASGKDFNLLVLDTEVYSNTGGQASKSTPRAAVAKYAAGGKPTRKKDLGLIAAAYGNVYVAQIAMGANNRQTIKAFREAEAHKGPSIIIAYSHCVAHGIDMSQGFEQQKKAVNCGHWPLWRYNPALAAEGKNPFVLDSKAPKGTFAEYVAGEGRYMMLKRTNPNGADALLEQAQQDCTERWEYYSKLANI